MAQAGDAARCVTALRCCADCALEKGASAPHSGVSNGSDEADCAASKTGVTIKAVVTMAMRLILKIFDIAFLTLKVSWLASGLILPGRR